MEVAGVLDKPLKRVNYCFSIAPRLNAAGRLGSAATAVELLPTNDESRARELALYLILKIKNVSKPNVKYLTRHWN